MVFDYGGVLTTAVGPSIRSWLARDGIDPESFTRALRSWMSRSAPRGTPIHRLETGELSVGDFETLLAAELTKDGGGAVPAAGLIAGLFAEVADDPAMFDLVAEIKASGRRVALLSNSWGVDYPRERIDSLFDTVVISGEVGMRKPDAEIFEHTLALAGTTAARAVFVDDAEPNIEGARRVGLTAVHHRDAASTRVALAELIPEL